MRLFSAARLAVLAAALLAVLGAFAGVSSGSASFVPPAQTPRLLAHDTSSFAPAGVHRVRRHHGLPGPQLLPIRRNTARRLFSASTLLTIDGATTSAKAPNASGDIGLTQFMQAVDGEYSVYSRTGTLLGAVTNTAFWSGLGGPDGAGLCDTHPQGQASVVYDRVADRFVVAEAAFSGALGSASGPFDECIAVSSTGDATGTWYRYVFQISASLYPDMPSLGVWSDGYYLSFNQLSATGSWDGVGAVAFQRSAMLNGGDATARYFNMQNTIGVGGMLPASNGGANTTASGPELFVQAHEDLIGTNDHLELWGFHADFSGTGSTFQPLAQIPVSSFDSGFTCSTDGCISQEVGGNVPFLDSQSRAHVASTEALPQLGGQVMYAHNGSLETLSVAHTVAVGSVAGIRWYRLQNSGSGWGVSTSGTYAPTLASETNRFIPAAAFDNVGEVALGYTLTGNGLLGPTLAYTDATSASVGDMTPATGGAAHGNSTWGRSMSVRLDPIGFCRFWMTGPVTASDGSWATKIVAFSFSGCSPSAAQPILTGDPTWSSTLVREGQTITGTAASFSGATSTTYAWQRCDSAGMNCVDIPGETATSHTMTAADAAGDRTLRFAETATNAYGSSTAVSTPTPVVQSIPPVNTALPVITGTAATNNLISTDNGSWTSSSPLTFTYRWRRCSGGTCSDISGATASTYTPTTDDLGSTLDVVVSATNTGGGTDAVAAETATIVVGIAPSTTTTTTTTSTTPTTVTSTSPVTNPPDLQLGVSASAASAPIGQRVTLFYTVTDKNKQPARNLKVTLTLPAGLEYAGAYAERGPGCAASGTQVVCSLDYVSALTPVTRVQVYLTVKDSSAQTVSATATSTDGDTSPSDNKVSIAVGTGSATTSTVSGTTAPPPILGPDGMPVGLNGTSSKSATGVDVHAPKVAALASTGSRGDSAALKFRISDDSGVASASATIERNGRKVGSVKTGFGPVAAGSIYFVAWHVPAKVATGKYTFCVVASDRSRHSSKQSCAPLTVR